jgi:hypothetical protein
MNEPTLRQGDQGEWVTHLQQLLVQAGYDPGPIDGDFRNGTRRAVEAFQAANGLDADGIVGPATWGALTGEGSPVSDGSDAVPSELVAAGAPPTLSEWTDEQKEAFFEGKVSESSEAGTPEEVVVVAIADSPSDEDGELA